MLQAINTGPVSCMTFDPTSTLLATGGSDATIKVWDVVKQYCTHNLRGHQGVVRYTDVTILIGKDEDQRPFCGSECITTVCSDAILLPSGKT